MQRYVSIMDPSVPEILIHIKGRRYLNQETKIILRTSPGFQLVRRDEARA
jgi:hypothetical protein